MTLRRRVVLTSLAVALIAAALVLWAIEWRRGRDMRLALIRVGEAHITESVRDQCVTDPMWFLAGPRTGRPSLAARQQPDADVFLPRPDTDEREFEVFAYNDQYSPTSTAGPRFPLDFRDAMRSSPPAQSMIGPWESEIGEGLQLARATGWSPGPCAVLLFRMQPVPGLATQRALIYSGLAGVFFVAMIAAFSPTLYRVRRTSLAIGQAAKEDYASVAPDHSKDEVSAMAFVFNDAATEIHRRGTAIRDRAETLKRHVDYTADEIARPLGVVEGRLAELVAGHARLPDEVQGEARAALLDAHALIVRLENISASAQLRTDISKLPVEAVDVREAVRRVVARYERLAVAAGVTLVAHLPVQAVPGRIHSLFERALGNLLDNAIAGTGPGGRVDLRLTRLETPDAFSVTVTDTGQGVTTEMFKGLTAIRRFRGDEAWNHRPNAPGLGLAVAREIADRSGLDLDLRRPEDGGFEAVLRTVTAA